MYVEMENAPVLGSMFARPSMEKIRYRRPARQPTWLLAGLGLTTNAANQQTGVGAPITGAITPTQKQICGAAQAWLAQHPIASSVLTSPACGVCPPAPTPEDQGYIRPSDCPAPESCLTPEDQGYILPGDCVSKSAPSGGVKWWMLLLAGGGGIGIGIGLGKMMHKKPGAL